MTVHSAEALASVGKSYFACHQPERPYGPDVCYDAQCRACWLASKAAVLAGHGEEIRAHSWLGPVTLAWACEEAARQYGHDRSAS